MCGIVGYVGKNNNCIPILIDGLERLEYRGYDSSGIAFKQKKEIVIIKKEGKIINLKRKIDFGIKSNLGIGHTRWATHGIPNTINAHPHQSGRITIVHNGIIENYNEIKSLFKNVNFKSETDTEVACVLLNSLYEKTNDIDKAIKEFKDKVKGSYAIAMLVSDIDDTIFAIKKNSPLIIGLNDNENYLASDVPAILKFTNKYYLLEDNEYAKIKSNDVLVYDRKGILIKKEIRTFDSSIETIDKLGYDHFMIKEINEQPEVIKNILLEYFKDNKLCFKEYISDINKYNKICIIACGSAVHAGLVGKSLIEEYAKIPVLVEIASEFRYKNNFIDENTLVIPISQSGETADTLEALKLAKEHHCDCLGIINVLDSSIARICDKVIYTKAGIEIAVATTKAYLAQVLILSLIALYFAKEKNLLAKTELEEIMKDLKVLPAKVQTMINNTEYNSIAKEIYKNNDIFFIGRQVDYALCLEGSLKLKEISYIHSEAYAAGELKHGTISLIDNNSRIFSIVTKNNISEKTISNIKEIKSRNGIIYLLITEDIKTDADFYDKKIILPKIHDLFQPIISIIPLQIIAYETAKLKCCDIDKPKNLAKSVTVE